MSKKMSYQEWLGCVAGHLGLFGQAVEDYLQDEPRDVYEFAYESPEEYARLAILEYGPVSDWVKEY